MDARAQLDPVLLHQIKRCLLDLLKSDAVFLNVPRRAMDREKFRRLMDQWIERSSEGLE